MQTYQSMKDSGIPWLGDIPSDWSIDRVKWIFKRKQLKEKAEDPVVLSLARSGVKIRDITNNKGQIADSYLNYNSVEPGDVLLNPMDLISGANCSVSKVNGVISPAYINIRPLNGDGRYFDYYFKVQYWSRAFFVHGKGVSYDNRWTLNTETIMNYPVIVPGFEQQKKIADYLDKETAMIDGLIAKQERLLQLLEEKRRAKITSVIMSGLSDDVQKVPASGWYPALPSHWGRSKLKYLCSLITDGTHVTPTYVADGVPFLSIKDISSGKIDFSNTKFISNEEHLVLSKHARVERGDILFTRIGTLGVNVLVDTDVVFDIFVSLGLLKLRPGAIDPSYLVYCMSSSYYVEYIQQVKAGGGTAAAKFNLGDVSNSPVIVPPYKEQLSIVEYLNRELAIHNELAKSVHRQITLLKERRVSLISNVVTGKVKV
jgi:type I restriction enzyme, S subunit